MNIYPCYRTLSAPEDFPRTRGDLLSAVSTITEELMAERGCYPSDLNPAALMEVMESRGYFPAGFMDDDRRPLRHTCPNCTDGTVPVDCGSGTPCLDCGYTCRDCKGTGAARSWRFYRQAAAWWALGPEIILRAENLARELARVLSKGCGNVSVDRVGWEYLYPRGDVLPSTEGLPYLRAPACYYYPHEEEAPVFVLERGLTVIRREGVPSEFSSETLGPVLAELYNLGIPVHDIDQHVILGLPPLVEMVLYSQDTLNEGIPAL